MFNKIKLLDQIATQIGLFGVNQGNETLMDYVDLNCGAIPEGEFETVIDLSAPHQFLQMYMQIAEKRFAFTCTELLKMNPGYIVALKDFLRRTGCELNSEKVETALQAFEKMDFYVLDGMPCDETKTIVEKSDEKIIKLILQNTLEVILKSVEMGDISITLSEPNEEYLISRNINGNYFLINISSSSLLLSESDLDCLFDPYKIVDTANRKNLLRAITLACVKNWVQALNGQIWVEFQILKNTGFNILTLSFIAGNFVSTDTKSE